MRNLRTSAFATSLFLSALAWAGCVHDPQPGPAELTTAGTGNYPEAVGKVLTASCATAGCHADGSSASSLAMHTWEALMEGGGSHGAVVVPFAPEQSPLLYYINRDSSLGPVALPAMPYNISDPKNPTAPVSREDYERMRNWIAAGAPSRSGEVAFASDPDRRQKVYMTQQGCDLVAVVDAESGAVMRYIPVGKSAAVESPHAVRVSADGRYAYVSFTAGDWVQKIDTRTDQVVGEVNMATVKPAGSWNVLTLSSDGSRFIISNFQAAGGVYIVNTGTMQVEQSFTGSGQFVNPHAIASSAGFDTFYITAQQGNVVYKLAPAVELYEKVSIDGGPVTFAAGTRDPHEILMAPGGGKYFLSCQASNEVRVMDARTDAVLAAIPVGTYPQELAISRTKPYLFVTCMEDRGNPNPAMRGSVYVINYLTHTVEKVLYGRLFQPHGVAADDRNSLVYVLSRNASADGIAPHHTGACAGKNGWYSIYDLNTLEPKSTRRYEVTVDPYSADVRFK